MSLLKQLALISESSSLTAGDLMVVAAALQKQATRDFGPIWDIEATVDAFDRLEDVPIGYWPMVVMDDIGFDAAGIHLDKDGQPYSLISSGTDWSLTASHECLEMLADPFGNRVMAGDSPKQDQGRVEFLVEVCDPSESKEFAYTVNGVLVSDFYTPQFFDPLQAPGVRYSFTGAIKEPRDVLRGGYLSWHEPVSDDWWQETWFSGNQSKFRNLGKLSAANGSLRSQIDRLTNQDSVATMRNRTATMASALTRRTVADACESKACSLHSQIQGVIQGSKSNSKSAPATTGRRRPPGSKDD